MIISWLDRWISSLSRRRVLALVTLFAVGIFVFDLMVPPFLQISIFYVIPVMMSSWYVSRFSGVIWAVLCAVLGALPHLLRITSSENPIFVVTWELGVHLILLGTIVLILDVVMSKLTRVQSLADRDLLTGALNKTAFTERLHQQLQLERRADWPLTLAYVDIDLFKQIQRYAGP